MGSRRSVVVGTALAVLAAACSSDGDAGRSVDDSLPVTGSIETSAAPPDREPGSDDSSRPPDQVSPLDPSETSDVDGTADVATDDAPCEPAIDHVRLVRQRSVPGGRQLHLALSEADGSGVDGALGVPCLTVTDERLGALDVAVGVAPTGPGATLIVARRSEAELESGRAVIDALVASRPADELVAVWSWADDVTQVVGTTTDRERIGRRLDATWTAPVVTARAPLPAEEVAGIAAEEWEKLADDALLGVRSIVFVAPTLELEELPEIDRDIVTDHWLVSAGTAEAVGARAVLIDSDAPSIDVVVATVAERLDSTRDANLAVVGFCDDGGDLDLSIGNGDVVERSFGVGDAADEHRDEPCSPASARDAAPPGRVVMDAALDPAERETYQRALQQLDERAQLPISERFDATDDVEWTGTMRFGEPVEAARYEAKFRGQSTLECDRRSRTIDFDGGDARHLLPASGTDEFTLISLCADLGYVRQITGQQVMAMFGLWHLESATVEFRLDGASQGVYLLGERLVDELRNDRTRVSSVVRRGYDVAGRLAEVDYATDASESAALARYDSLVEVAQGLEGTELVETLRARLDLDQYLYWIAVNTALANGDYIDEVYFVEEETLGPDGGVAPYSTIHAWDPDGLFAPCHREGRLAIDDPNGLLYCTEALLDRAIFDDPVVYDLYVDVLADVLDQLAPGEFAGFATDAAASVTRWFDDEAVSSAMNEFDDDLPAPGPDGKIAFVEGVAADLVAMYETRRVELRDRIDEYRSG